MQSGVITFSTVTCAMKAQGLLQRSGIRVEIQKTQDGQHRSCQYCVRVRSRFDTAVRMLNQRNIPFQTAVKDDGA
ncbi:MAG: putative Se/S carrier-like protein [Acetanaerobacterium sp.]